MGGQESEEGLRSDPVSATPEIAVSAIASPSTSDCSQPGLPDWQADSQMQYRRDQLLEATARAANVLLTLDNLSEAINTALNIIGEGAGCDLIVVIENLFESASPLPVDCNFIYEWAAPGLPLPTANLSAKSFPSEFFGLAFLEQYFLEGSGFGGLVEDWHEPIRSWFASAQVQSAYTVPIRVNGQWWGVLCFDYCRAPIQIDSAETAVLQTIADCIGSAIQRERLHHAALSLQQERQQIAQQRTADLEAYNQVLQGRDRLLEATAKAANVLLTVENFDEAMNNALEIILEGAGCDRLKVLENSFDGLSVIPEFGSMIYVCTRPGMSVGESRIYSNWLPKEFVERYFLHGEGFFGLLYEFDEPMRSKIAGSQSQSGCAVPIRVNGHWWGTLTLNYSDAIQISPAQFAVVKTIADCIGSAIQRDRLQQERQQVAQQRTTALEEYNQRLLWRDRLLEVTARATNVLLTLDHIDVAIESALTVLIEGTGCDRLEILENVYESSSSMPIRYLNTIQKCLDSKFEISPTDIEPAAAEELRGAFQKYFLEMDGFGGLLEEWDEPLRSWLATLQIQSTYAVPIRVNGQWWGILCFDYCRAPIQFNPAEVAVLRTTADCIGSVIQRERLRQAELRLQQEREQVAQQRTVDLEAYNQVLQGRDRLFAATAKAANVLLTLENFDEAVNTALQCIGEGTGCDYVVVLENMLQSSSPLPSSCDFIYEWATPGFLPLSVTFGSTSLSSELLGLDFMKQYFLEGDGFGGLTEVWNEPLRSVLVSVQIQSTYAVPIRVNGQWWGVLSLDYCRAPIEISAAEISALMAIADCIGSAIQRDRTQKTMLQAEQIRVSELVKANTALKQSLDTFAADSDLDRFIGNTLTVIAQQFDAPLIEYWVHAQAGSETSIHLAYWQGQILSATNGSIINADPLGLVQFLDIPLSVGEANIGVLSIYLPVHRTFSRQTIELTHALAQQLTLAVELTRLAEEARQAALLQERTRMAREIHDTLAQAFGGILMQLQAFTYLAQTQPDQAQTHLLTAQALAKEGLTEARRSVWALYLETTEYENLDQAIAKFIEQTMSRQTTPIHLTIEGTPYLLHPDLGLNLLRIAQEAITNALRHAHAIMIQVHLSYSVPILQLTIRDDGCGFDPQSPTPGFGLLGMQQRASRIGATWNLMSRPGEGTTLMITLTNN